MTIRTPLEANMKLGGGLRVLSNAGTSSPFLESSIQSTSDLMDKTVVRNRRQISSYADYSLLVTEAAEVSGKGLGWSASAAVKHLKSSVHGSTSLIFSDHIYIRLSTESLNLGELKLKPDAEALLRLDAQKFLDQYGTHAITAVERGGEFISTLTLNTSTTSTTESLAASLRGSWSGAVNVSGRADFEQQVRSAAGVNSMEAYALEQGGALAPFKLGELSSMMEKGDNFATKLQESNKASAVSGRAIPWDEIDCVRIALAGKPLPAIGSGEVWNQLWHHSLRLTYLSNAIQRWQDGKLYNGALQQTQIATIDAAASRARDVLNGLSIERIAGMSPDAARGVVNLDPIETEMTELEAGTATLIVECTILPGWQYVSFAYPHTANLGAEGFRCEVANLRPEANRRIKVADAYVGLTMGYFFLEYEIISGFPQVRVIADARGSWVQIGEWIRGTGESTTIGKPKIGPKPGPEGDSGGLIMTARFK